MVTQASGWPARFDDHAGCVPIAKLLRRDTGDRRRGCTTTATRGAPTRFTADRRQDEDLQAQRAECGVAALGGFEHSPVQRNQGADEPRPQRVAAKPSTTLRSGPESEPHRECRNADPVMTLTIVRCRCGGYGPGDAPSTVTADANRDRWIEPGPNDRRPTQSPAPDPGKLSKVSAILIGSSGYSPVHIVARTAGTASAEVRGPGRRCRSRRVRRRRAPSAESARRPGRARVLGKWPPLRERFAPSVMTSRMSPIHGDPSTVANRGDHAAEEVAQRLALTRFGCSERCHPVVQDVADHAGEQRLLVREIPVDGPFGVPARSATSLIRVPR